VPDATHETRKPARRHVTLIGTSAIAILTGRTESTIRGWALQGLLPRRGAGHHCYALEDAERLAEGHCVTAEVDTIAAAFLIGVPAHTIRNWASRGHLQPLRTEGTRTIYDAEAVVRAAATFGYLAELREQDERDDEHCCTPGCEDEALDWPDLKVPLCRKHAIAVWLRVTDEWKSRQASLLPGQPRHAQSVVYFIKAGDRIKIGRTTRLPARMDAIATSTPEKLEILLVVAGGDAEEKQVHALFSDDRIRGEWFRSSPRLTQFIAERRDQDIRAVHGRYIAL
jgi:DNA-binding transcriptional MerR regulator